MIRPHKRRTYLPLTYRVAGVNAVVLIATVVVTVVVLAPRKFASVALPSPRGRTHTITELP